MVSTERSLSDNRALNRLFVILAMCLMPMLFGQPIADRLTVVVGALLDHPPETLGREATLIMTSGDNVARTILRRSDCGTLTPRQVRIALYLVTGAFIVPENISTENDRVPNATMELLNCLAKSSSGNGNYTSIKTARETVLKSIEAYTQANLSARLPHCEVVFHVLSKTKENTLQYVHIEILGQSEIFQTDEHGYVRLRMLAGRSDTYTFHADGHRDASETVFCIQNEIVNRRVILTQE